MNDNQERAHADHTIVAVFDTSNAVDQALQSLADAGYTNRDVALVTRHAGNAESSGASATSDGPGRLGDTTLAFLGEGTALSVPGIGQLLLAAGGALTVAPTGNWLGSLFGLDAPDDIAQHYGDLACDGKFLLFVRPLASDQQQVEDRVRDAGTTDVQSYSYAFTGAGVLEEPSPSGSARPASAPRPQS